MTAAKVEKLVAATRAAYRQLEGGADAEDVLAPLVALFARHGLDADVAESSLDWLEGGTLADDLNDAIARNARRSTNREGITS